MTNIQVRRAAAADAEAIGRLLGELGYPTASGDVPGRLATVEAEGGAGFVATDEQEQVVGVATVIRYMALHRPGPGAYITAFVVDETVRGRGVGKAILAEIERWALDQGCVRLTVTSHEDRSGAHAFYERAGLPYTGRRFSRSLPPR
jgi:GNAT superfamily N-acetyltransferase